MTMNVLFAAAHERWHTYQAPLRKALEARDISFHLAQDIAPENVDYIVYAPSSEVQDFTPLSPLQSGAQPLGRGGRCDRQSHLKCAAGAHG